MNILFVSALLPYPLHSGGQVRIYNLLKRLSHKHSITLCSFIRSKEEEIYVNSLKFLKKVHLVLRGSAWQSKFILSTVYSPYPFLMTTYDNSNMKINISEELMTQSYDLVHLEPFYVWPSIPPTNIPVVVSEHNVEYEVYTQYVKNFPILPLRPFLYADVLKMRFWERRIWKNADSVTGVSDYDTDKISQVRKEGKSFIVPNGVDIHQFSYRPKKAVSKDPVFLFVGTFKWIQNSQALQYLTEQLWPKIKSRYPSAILRVVGKSLPHALEIKLKKFNASYIEQVEDITLEYQEADVLLAPIWVGGGTRYKILEAMASGLPVVTTPEGAKGLKVNGGRELLIADTAETLVESCVTVLENPQYRQKIVKEAREVAEKYYSWEHIAILLENVWKTVGRLKK